MSRWTVVYERTVTGWSAFVPALPGVGVAGVTREDTELLVRDAIALHLRGMVQDGLPVPDPRNIDVGQIELPQGV